MTDRTTTSSSSSRGVGFTGALFLVLLVLKLTHVIDWSWWWVTAPLWGGLVILIVVAVLALAGFGIVTLMRRGRERREES